MELFNKISNLLLSNPNGLKITEISKILNMEYGPIWTCLNKHPEQFFKDVDIWYIKTESNKYFESTAERAFLKKFQNYENAKVFDLDYFNSLSNWKYCSSQSSGIEAVKYKTKTGNVIECDSKSEIKMLEYLESNKFVRAIGGQNISIQYSTAFGEGKSYYPDFVALTNKGYIAIIEVKAATAMSNHINISKYNALAEECIRKGYIYTMIDPDNDFLTFEELRDMPVNEELLNLFKEISEDEECFLYEKEDVDEWWDDLADYYDTKKEFELEVHSLIIYHNMYNKFKNGFYFCNEPFK